MATRKHVPIAIPVKGGEAIAHGDPRMSAKSRAALQGIAQAAIDRLSANAGHDPATLRRVARDLRFASRCDIPVQARDALYRESRRFEREARAATNGRGTTGREVKRG